MPAIGAMANGDCELDGADFHVVSRIAGTRRAVRARHSRVAVLDRLNRNVRLDVRGVHFDADRLADQFDRSARRAFGASLRIGRPTTLLNGPWTTSTIIPS